MHPSVRVRTLVHGIYMPPVQFLHSDNVRRGATVEALLGTMQHFGAEITPEPPPSGLVYSICTLFDHNFPRTFLPDSSNFFPLQKRQDITIFLWGRCVE